MLGDKKQSILNNTKQIFESKGIVYEEKANGHLKIDYVDYWATTSKWYDPVKEVRGVGLNSFLNHLEKSYEQQKKEQEEMQNVDDDFKALVKDVQDFIRTNYNSNTKVVVDSVTAEVLVVQAKTVRKIQIRRG